MKGLGVLTDRVSYPTRCYVCMSGAGELIHESLGESRKAGRKRPKVGVIWRALHAYEGPDLKRDLMPAHPNSLRGHLEKHEERWSREYWA